MKKMFLSIFLPYFAFSAAAVSGRTKLLECSMYGGDYQEIRVYQNTENELTLYMLNRYGSAVEKSLPKKQWTEQKIILPCESSRSGCGYVYKSQGAWVYKTGYSGFYNYGTCQ